MIRSILQAPDERLRETAQDAFLSPDLPGHIKDLCDTFKSTRSCIGLAAPQIGIPYRVIVVDITEKRNETYVMVNPVLALESHDKQQIMDGCVSIERGHLKRVTRRPKRIEMCWVDVQAAGELRHQMRQKFTGLLAACIHHEMDHLLGILFTDRVGVAKR